MKTRVRFAPSPTGPLHIGGLRTALFNYLFARKEKGSFILRVEDTDQNRYVNGSEEYIQEALEWCGMQPDEGPKNGGEYGPYRQSERKKIYAEYIKLLIEKGGAYYAFDSNDSLSHARKTAEKNGESFKYGATNRMFFKNSLTLGKDEVELALKEEYVIRLKVEAGVTVNIYDEIRGTVQVNTDELDDKILMKSDGMPTYHFANVVDDHLMQISCVIRGEEWLPSLPLHKLIYDAYGWDTPKFMHLPLILKPTGKGKLSKRDGDKGGFPVFPLNWGEDTPGFREKGFLAEGMINYLALLGWNDGTENEFFSLKDLETKFSVSGIQKGGARFNYEKARWVNHHKIGGMNTEELTAQSEIAKLMEGYPKEQHLSLVNLVKERLYTLKDLKEEIAFVQKTYPYDEKVLNKLKDKNPIVILNKIKETIEKETPNLKESLVSWAKEQSIPMGALMQSFR
ncbi:MAG: glutamate--tRNA ligase, partial [Flavobacteriaceae bacterium]